MGYLALYRQWRPQRLGNLVGQKHVTDTLLNALTSGKVSHAYLFCGPRGTGKTSTAQILARAVNCLDPRDGEPCNECLSCREILSGASMDVIEIDAASNRGIDEIRELKENIKYFPSLGAKRIYIVDEVHMLTNEAFNALLKTLEEPPEHGLFILATTEPHKVPLTILSRCQRFDFRPIADALINEQLRAIAAQSNFSVTDEALIAITRSASGSLRDALSVLDQALLLCGEGVLNADIVHSILGTITEDVLRSLSAALAERDGATALRLVAQVSSEGKDIKQLGNELTGYLRRLMIYLISPHNNGEEAFNAPPQELRQLFNRRHLMDTLGYLVEAEQTMRRSAYPRMVLELALVRAVEEAGDYGMHDLLQRIEKLEQAKEPVQSTKQTQLVQNPVATEQKKENKPHQTAVKQNLNPPKTRVKPVEADEKSVKMGNTTPSRQIHSGKEEISATVEKRNAPPWEQKPVIQNLNSASAPPKAVQAVVKRDADEVADYPPWYATEQEESLDHLEGFADTWDGLPDWPPIETPPWDRGVQKPEAAVGQTAVKEQATQKSRQVTPTAPLTQPKQTGAALSSNRESPAEEKPPQINGQPLDEPGYSLGQLNNWWPEILSTVKKSNPLAYSWLCQVWPAEIKEHCLVLGIPQGDSFLKSMIESPDKKKLLIQTLNAVTHLNWQISCQFYDDSPPNLPKSTEQLKAAETINLFQGSVLDIVKDQ